MQLHADTHAHARTHPHTQTKDSKTFLFPTVELFQLARNTDMYAWVVHKINIRALVQ